MGWSDLDDLIPLRDPTELPRVLSRQGAHAMGFSRRMIETRLASGRWRRVLPHTFLTADTLTWTDRLTAVTFAGPRALLTGGAVLHDAGFRSVPRPGVVTVIVPQRCGSRSTRWVRVRRTARVPEADAHAGPRRVSVGRAVADHALRLHDIDDVRAVVAEATRCRLCSTSEIAEELAAGPRAGSALLRQALGEVTQGAWSAPEARAARVLRRAGAPPFQQNAPIERPGLGRYVADFLWCDLRAILEIDSIEYHTDPASWEATMTRDLRLETLAFSVVHQRPSTIRDEPGRFVRDVMAWLVARAADSLRASS